jgi:hypothetical protein
MGTRRMLHHFHSKSQRAATFAVLGALALTSGCGSDAQETNFDRGNLFTEIAAGINTSAPSDVSALQGQATYNGAAKANFAATSGFGGFGGTADARLTADFKNRTISGSMTSWKDLDPLNHELRGQIQLSSGVIADNGSFTTTMTGNIERTVLTGETNPANVPDLRVFTGTADGQIFDSVQGAAASHVAGAFIGTELGGGSVDGAFVARQ